MKRIILAIRKVFTKKRKATLDEMLKMLDESSNKVYTFPTVDGREIILPS